MQRPTPSGEPAIDAARREANRLAAESQASTITETNAPARAVPGATAWLIHRSGRGEVVVVSDFQLGTVDSSDLGGVPPSLGVRLSRINIRPAGATFGRTVHYGNGEMIVRATLSADHTQAEWLRRAPASGAANPVLILADAGAQRAADAAERAAGTIGVPLPIDTSHAVAIVFSQRGERADWLKGATGVTSPWATEFLQQLAADSVLVSAALSANIPASSDSGAPLVVVRNAAGRPVVTAAQKQMQGRDRLILVSFADAGSVASAALIAATRSALSIATPVTEWEPEAVADSTLASWQRAPSANSSARPNADGDDRPSDGRWFWILALLLLALESWMRRPVAAPTAALTDADNVA
jgi:hypothetical protein